MIIREYFAIASNSVVAIEIERNMIRMIQREEERNCYQRTLKNRAFAEDPNDKWLSSCILVSMDYLHQKTERKNLVILIPFGEFGCWGRYYYYYYYYCY